MLDAIGYVRVSTNEQADHGVSLDAQYESLMAYALLQKLNLVEVIVEDAISGSVPLADRPGGRRLLELVGKRRLGRSSPSSWTVYSAMPPMHWRRPGYGTNQALRCI